MPARWVCKGFHSGDFISPSGTLSYKDECATFYQRTYIELMLFLHYRFPHNLSFLVLWSTLCFLQKVSAINYYSIKLEHVSWPYFFDNYLFLLSSLLPDTSCREELKTFCPLHFPSKQWLNKKHFKVILCLFDAGIS